MRRFFNIQLPPKVTESGILSMFNKVQDPSCDHLKEVIHEIVDSLNAGTMPKEFCYVRESDEYYFMDMFDACENNCTVLLEKFLENKEV